MVATVVNVIMAVTKKGTSQRYETVVSFAVAVECSKLFVTVGFSRNARLRNHATSPGQ